MIVQLQKTQQAAAVVVVAVAEENIVHFGEINTEADEVLGGRSAGPQIDQGQPPAAAKDQRKPMLGLHPFSGLVVDRRGDRQHRLFTPR